MVVAHGRRGGPRLLPLVVLLLWPPREGYDAGLVNNSLGGFLWLTGLPGSGQLALRLSRARISPILARLAVVYL